MYVRNSLIVSNSMTVVTVLVACLTGYSLSRFGRLRGITQAGIGLLLATLVPSVLLVVPLYLMMQTLNLLNTFGSLGLAYASFAVPLSSWMLKGYFDEVPLEIEDAAQIDGCHPAEVLFRVVLRVALPGLMATTLYAFAQARNEFLFAYLGRMPGAASVCSQKELLIACPRSR